MRQMKKTEDWKPGQWTGRWKEAIREAPGEILQWQPMQSLFPLVYISVTPPFHFLVCETWFSQWCKSVAVAKKKRKKVEPQWLQWLCGCVMFCKSWCGYMKGGLPERGPALPILMVISSESRCWNEGCSAFSLESGGRAKAVWGSAPTPC